MLNLAAKARPYFGAVVLSTALLAAGGVYSATRMASGVYPEVTFPRIAVVAKKPGLDLRNMELQVTVPLEQAVSTVIGVERVRSKTIRGGCDLSIDFSPGTDMRRAEQLTWNRIGAARGQMPPDVEFTVEQMTPSVFPILSVVLTGGDSASQLRDFAYYQLAPKIKNIPDVLYCNVAGGDLREIVVEAHPDELLAAGLSAADLADQIGKLHRIQPVGRIEEPPFAFQMIVNTQGQTARQVADLVLATKNGQPLRVRDVADVQVLHQDRVSSVGYEGKDAVVLTVFRRLGGNTVNISHDVQNLLARYPFPRNVHATMAYDQARFVNDAVDNVRDAIIVGGAFSILILLGFLRSWRATLISALAIPITLAITFLFLYWSGETFNLMSLGGLAVAIGLIIDDTVVVIENIARHLAPSAGRAGANAHPVDAASGEITGAVVGSTLTTVLVFVPLAFIVGVYGQFFTSLSWALCIAVLVSMVISLTLVPVCAAKFLGGRPMPEPGPIYRGVARLYEWGLAGALRFPRLALSLSFLAVIAGVLLYTGIPAFDVSVAWGRLIPGLGVFALGLLLALLLPVWMGRRAGRLVRVVALLLLAGSVVFSEASGRWLSESVQVRARQSEPGKPPPPPLMRGLETGLMPSMDEGAFVLDYWAPAGTPLKRTEEIAHELEEILSENPDVQAYVRRTGAELGLFATQTNRGDIQVILRPAENDPVSLLTKRVRPPFNEVEEELKRDGKESVRRKYRRRPLRAVMKEVEEEIEEHFSEHQLKKEAIQIMEDELNDLSGSNRPVEVKLFGPDYKKLRELAEEVSETLEKKGKGRGIKEVNSNVFAGNPDLMIDVDRLAAERVGLTAMDIERQLRAMYLGQVATQVRESALRITDVRVRYPNDLRFGRGRFDLDLLRRQWLLLPPLAAGNGTASNGSAGSAYQGPAALARAVPVSAVARVVPVRTPDEQTRENQQPAQIVTADLNESEAGLGSVVADIRRWMGELSEKGKIPPGYRWEVGGHYVRQQEAFRSLAVVMVVAILLVFILLAFQFRSVALPLLIFLTQPLSLVSGLFALWLTGTPLNVSSYMGTILLIGLDMKNGILLVEYIQQLRAEGVGLHEALLLAGRTRFRPILMTSLAAILGLFPLALGIGPGAQMQQPLAIMVIGGLTANMLFTRMIIPVGYLLLERGKAPAEAPKVAADPAPGAAG